MSESEKLGIEKLQKVSLLLVSVGGLIAKLAKDGVDLSDAVVLAGNEDLKVLLKELMEYKDLLAEVKDVDLAEGLQLSVVVIPKLIEVIKA